MSHIFFPRVAAMCFHYLVYFANFVKALHCVLEFPSCRPATGKHPWNHDNRFASILFLHALAWNQDYMVCYHNNWLIMLTVAYLTFCSTGGSSVRPWLAAHCTCMFRPSPRRCVRAVGWKFPRGSEQCEHVLMDSRCWVRALLLLLFVSVSGKKLLVSQLRFSRLETVLF